MYSCVPRLSLHPARSYTWVNLCSKILELDYAFRQDCGSSEDSYTQNTLMKPHASSKTQALGAISMWTFTKRGEKNYLERILMRLENQENRARVQEIDCLFSQLILLCLTSKFLKTSFLEKWLRHNVKLKRQETKLYTLTHWKMVKLWFSLHYRFSELFKFPIINICYYGRNTPPSQFYLV